MSLVQEGGKKPGTSEEKDPLAEILQAAISGDESAMLALKILNNMALAQNQSLRTQVQIQALSNCAKAVTLQE